VYTVASPPIPFAVATLTILFLSGISGIYSFTTGETDADTSGKYWALYITASANKS